jgi:hypothetical protein
MIDNLCDRAGTANREWSSNNMRRGSHLLGSAGHLEHLRLVVAVGRHVRAVEHAKLENDVRVAVAERRDLHAPPTAA